MTVAAQKVGLNKVGSDVVVLSDSVVTALSVLEELYDLEGEVQLLYPGQLFGWRDCYFCAAVYTEVRWYHPYWRNTQYQITLWGRSSLQRSWGYAAKSVSIFEKHLKELWEFCWWNCSLMLLITCNFNANSIPMSLQFSHVCSCYRCVCASVCLQARDARQMVTANPYCYWRLLLLMWANNNLVLILLMMCLTRTMAIVSCDDHILLLLHTLFSFIPLNFLYTQIFLKIANYNSTFAVPVVTMPSPPTIATIIV